MSTPPSLTSSVRQHAAGAYHYAQRSLDRVVEPETRLRVYDASYALASTRPLIFSAALALLFFSALPILLFAVFSVCVASMAVGGGILFALFWLALGVLVLVPTLAVTSVLALVVWAWVVGSFIVVRAMYGAVVKWDAGRYPAGAEMKGLRQQQQLRQPPPVPQSRPEKKSANGNGQETNAPVDRDA
ncbi:hypothetical protein A9K55_007774 [Cordyceps militaris]|uniref:Uncharacterized protein n=1 Tax=Cordyceps militaris TaxID=73501 RepID=A0A2H4SFK4_CORMI|nr:hypothetical protein A9K55_007774 [Cordyceps militaris]